MRLEIFESKGLAHYSYYLSDKGEAVVVDPQRDCEVYTRFADMDCAKIVYILETHRNEDYVIGSLELQNLADAEIAHSKEASFEYGEHRLEDEDILNIGEIQIKAIYTPGHTNDSVCYVVYSLKNPNIPMLVFTGDTLFAGDVGRTDLLGKDIKREQSGKLYDSLQNKVYPLGDHVQVFPSHGGGSVCGHNISDRQSTTIGYEWKTNPLLTMKREEFIEVLMKQDLSKPPYFSKMEVLNLKGPPLIEDCTSTPALNIEQFQKEMVKKDRIVVDTREVGAFASCHIPGSINIWLDGVSFFPGWVVSYDQSILLVNNDKRDLETAKRYLCRLGFDNIIGYLCPGIEEWRNSGKEIEHFGTFSAVELKENLDKNKTSLLDVRSSLEWSEGHIECAKHVYVGELNEHIPDLEKDKTTAVICSVANRAGLGASILKKAGFVDVYNVLGGITAWKKLNYPLKKDEKLKN
jgi:hydroxyacylglutathione hydrolase